MIEQVEQDFVNFNHRKLPNLTETNGKHKVLIKNIK
jgi:hypothetical protein